jgi:hypothetical protein
VGAGDGFEAAVEYGVHLGPHFFREAEAPAFLLERPVGDQSCSSS